MTPPDWDEKAREWRRKCEHDEDDTAEGCTERVYVCSVCVAQALREAHEQGRRQGLEEAATEAEGFPATDAFDALDPCCYCEGVAKAIRALSSRGGKNG